MSNDDSILGGDAEGLAVMQRAEIDQQIATAKRYPRSVTAAVSAAESMATMTQATAESCFYVLKRRGKDGQINRIEGASIRLAEIFASAWGNLRSATRIIGETEKYIVAQGVCFDLQSNVAISQEVRRRITTKDGHRFSEDMIVVTANAAASLALRNAILRVIPRSYVDQVRDKCKAVAVGDGKTLDERRQALLGYLTGKVGVDLDRILYAVGKERTGDIDLNDLSDLHGAATAIRDGDSTVDAEFPPRPAPVAPGAAAGAGGETPAAPAAPRRKSSKLAEQLAENGAAERVYDATSAPKTTAAEAEADAPAPAAQAQEPATDFNGMPQAPAPAPAVEPAPAAAPPDDPETRTFTGFYAACESQMRAANIDPEAFDKHMNKIRLSKAGSVRSKDQDEARAIRAEFLRMIRAGEFDWTAKPTDWPFKSTKPADGAGGEQLPE